MVEFVLVVCISTDINDFIDLGDKNVGDNQGSRDEDGRPGTKTDEVHPAAPELDYLRLSS